MWGGLRGAFQTREEKIIQMGRCRRRAVFYFARGARLRRVGREGVFWGLLEGQGIECALTKGQVSVGLIC